MTNQVQNPLQGIARLATKYAVGVPLKLLVSVGYGFLDGLEEAMEYGWSLSPRRRQGNPRL